jgi:diguanylate cyclase (GGDEF)-like protein
LYFGSLLALGTYNLLLYFSIRDRAYLEYVLCAAGMAIGLASANGFAQQFVWPEWPAWSNVAYPFGFSIGGLFGAMFTRTFLDTRRTAPRMHRLLAVIMGLFVLSMAAYLVSYRLAAMLVSLGGLAVSVISLSAGVVAWRRGHPGARFFLLAWTVLLIGVGVMGMRNFGWLPTNLFTVYAMQVGSTLDLLLLSFALADRINSMRGEKEAAQAESIEAKQRMLETLMRTEEELEARVEARTRELEAANAHLMDNERTLSKLARQDVLTGLGNRIALEEEMLKAIARASRLGVGVAAMLIDLDRFKPVNDEHGHGVGDEVLRLVAARLRECTRKTDTVARLGGDEFVVVLEGRNVVTDAHAVAEKIVACMDKDISLHGLTLRVGASIGIAVLVGADTPDDLLRRADQAMYVAKRQGGNRYALD